MEEWKDIEGYEGYYQVSNFGRVRSVDRWITTSQGVKRFYKGVIKTPRVTAKLEYPFLILYKGKSQKTCMVHRLVAIAFIPNPKPRKYTQVNHDDGNKENPHWENLYWTDASGNALHAFRTGLNEGRKGTKHHNSRLTESLVKEILQVLQEKKISIDDISAKYGIVNSAISKINRGVRWGHVMPELPRPVRTRSDAKRIYDSSSSPDSRR